MQLTYFDLAVIVVLILFGIRGGMRGFLLEAAGILGLVAGLFLAQAFFQQLTSVMEQFIAANAAPAVAFISLFLLGMLLVAIVVRVLQSILNFAFAGWLDATLGVGVGVVKGLILCALLAYALLIIIPHFPEIQDSESIPWLMEGVRRFAAALNLNIPIP